MKKLILLAGVAALASCGEPAATNEAAPAENDMATNAAAVEEESAAGTYEVTWPDGTVSTTVINEDGTWTSTGADGEAVGGTYAENAEGQACFSMEGEEDRCWTDGETVDGVTTSTDADGVVITYKRVDG